MTLYPHSPGFKEWETSRDAALPSQYFGATGLELPESLSFDHWLAVGEQLKNAEKSLMWWIGDWWAFGEHKYGERYAQALDPESYSKQTLMDAGWVARKVETSRRREVLSWSHHKEIASLEPDHQERWLGLAEKENWSRKDLRREIADWKRGVVREQKVLEAAAVGKFSVVYADPPWRYEYPPMGGTGRSIENHYPTMELQEICDLSVGELADDDAVLFLWATSPKLAECMSVIEAWGFEYRTSMVWKKDKIGMGYYARNQHELLLIARRGQVPVPDVGARPNSVIEAERGKHSAKPEIFYELIEAMYPGMSKVELFARNRREGWEAWGNQAE